MTVRRPHRSPARRGAVAVEAAFVISIFLLFVFGIFEYGRVVMLYNLLVNATREGGRYALVHSQDATVVADVTTQVQQRLSIQVGQFTTLQVSVYPTNNPTAALNTLNPDDPITVKVTGKFNTLLPSLLKLPPSITLTSATVMTCEGN